MSGQPEKRAKFGTDATALGDTAEEDIMGSFLRELSGPAIQWLQQSSGPSSDGTSGSVVRNETRVSLRVGSASAGSAPAGSAPAGVAFAGSALGVTPTSSDTGSASACVAPAGFAFAGVAPAGSAPAGSAPAGVAFAGSALGVTPTSLDTGSASACVVPDGGRRMKNVDREVDHFIARLPEDVAEAFDTYLLIRSALLERKIRFDMVGGPCREGKVFENALAVLESCGSAFKIGITHDPAHRWQNEVYGYGRVVDGGFRYKRMVVVFISMNADVVAMFEAGLIHVGLRAFGQRCRNKALGGESKGRGHTGGPHFAYVVFAE
jgi:hypothetical protein